MSVKITMDGQLGLPRILADLISSENADFDGSFRWKVVCDNSHTQLTLTWDKAVTKNSPYRPIPVHHDHNNMYYGHGNQNNRYGNGLYRRKTPSEIRRNQRRKIQHLQKRLEHGQNRGEIPNGKCATERDVPAPQSVSNIMNDAVVMEVASPEGCIAKVPEKPPKCTPKPNVKTRSMAKQEDSY